MRFVIALVALLAVGLTAPSAAASTPPPVADSSGDVVSTGVQPAAEVPFDLARFDELPGIDPSSGLLIQFDEPLYGADSPLAHGARVWGATPDGFSLVIASTDVGPVLSSWVKAYRDDQAGVYGLFIPIANREAQNFASGQYSVTIPAGSLFFAGGRVNEVVTYNWNFIRTEPDGIFAVVSPQAGRPLRSVEKLEVASQALTHYVGIESVSPRVAIGISDKDGLLYDEVWATGSLVGDRAVFVLDAVISTEAEEEDLIFTIPAGAFTTTSRDNSQNALCNGAISATLTLHPNFETRSAINTVPYSGTPVSIESFIDEHFVNEQPGFLVTYDVDVLPGTPDGRLWTTQPDGFSFTYTSPDGLDSRDMSWIWTDVMAYNPDDFNHTKALDIPMTDVFEGTYRLVVPEGAFQLQGGAYNAAIDYTWTMIHTLGNEMFEVVNPTSGLTYPYIDCLVVRPSDEAVTMYGDDISIIRTAEKVDVDYFYTTPDGTVSSSSVAATVTVTPDGCAVFTFDEQLSRHYPVDFTFKIPAGSFFCANGYSNNNYYTSADAPYHVEQPTTFRLRGATLPAQRVPGPVFSTVTITNAEPLGELGQNQTLTILMVDATDKTEYIKGQYAPKSVTVTTNAEGQSVLTIELPDEVVAAMSSNNNEKAIDITLSGYTDDDKANGVSPDQCFVKNAQGLPNAPVNYFFIVDPTAEYTYSFSFAYAAPANYSITIDGHTEAANEYGVVNFPHITRLLKAEDITVNGVSDEVIYHFGRPEYDWETGGLYVHVDLMPDVEPRLTELSFCDVPIDLPTATIPIDKVSSTPPCSLLFDREIDPNSISQQIFAEHCTIADVLNHQRYLAWFATGANWMGFGIDTYSEPLAMGTYYFHIDEHTFRFIDGKWNDPIDFSIEITGYPDFEYTTYAVGYMTADQEFVVEENVGELLGGFHTIALGYNPQRYSFTDPVQRTVEAIVYTEANPKGVVRKGNLVPVTDAQGRTWLGLSLPDPMATGPSYIIEEGSATITIPAGAIIDDHGATNENDINLWFNIADYFIVNIYVDGELSNDYVIQYTKYQDREYAFEQRPRYNASTGDHILKADKPTMIVPFNSDPFYRYIETNIVGLNYNIYLTYVNTTPYYINDYAVDGKDGLRTATLTFNTPSSPFDARAFHKKANWSDGFRLTQQRTGADGSTVELEADTNISYITTECSGQSVTLHFFTAEGVEFYPLEQGNTYYLEVPIEALFMSARHFGGLGREIDGLSFTNTAYKLRFNLEGVPEEIVTDDPDYDAAANRTFAGKARSLADILLGKRRSGSAVNDLDGNGEITITDIVRLISRHIHVTGSGSSTGTGSGSTGTDEYPEGWHPVAVGTPDNPGDEAL